MATRPAPLTFRIPASDPAQLAARLAAATAGGGLSLSAVVLAALDAFLPPAASSEGACHDPTPDATPCRP